MIRESATVVVEEGVPRLQRLEEAAEIGDVHIARDLQFVRPCVEAFGRIHCECFVGAIRGINFRRTVGGGERFVIAQIICRIVRGAKCRDVKLLQDTLRGESGRGELLVRFVPDTRGGGFI